jgi:hypothetical protein
MVLSLAAQGSDKATAALIDIDALGHPPPDTTGRARPA